MDNVTEKLVQCFGYRKFKSELQERAVRAIARGKCLILITLCYCNYNTYFREILFLTKYGTNIKNQKSFMASWRADLCMPQACIYTVTLINVPTFSKAYQQLNFLKSFKIVQ